MFAMFELETTVFPFDQLYVFPPLPIKDIEGMLQVSSWVFGFVVIEAIGKEISCVIVIELVETHPF